jgi:hypothetical protein
MPFGLAAVFNYLRERGFNVGCVVPQDGPPTECALLGIPLQPGATVVIIPFRGNGCYPVVVDMLCAIFGMKDRDALFADITATLKVSEDAGRLESLPSLRAKIAGLHACCAELEKAGATPR